MSYFMVEPNQMVTAVDLIKIIGGTIPTNTPTSDEIKNLDLSEEFTLETKALSYSAACKVTSNIVKAEGKMHQRIIIFNYERSSTIHKPAHLVPSDAGKTEPASTEDSTDANEAPKLNSLSTAGELIGWRYGAGFRIIVNHMTAEASSAMSLPVIAMESSLGKRTTTLMIQAFGATKLMPAFPSGHSGFSEFDITKLASIEKWVDECRVAIGDGWSSKTEEEQQKILQNTTPVLTGVTISTAVDDFTTAIDPLTRFCLWRFAFSDKLETSIKYLKDGKGSGAKTARQYPELISDKTITDLYRKMYLEYGSLSDLEIKEVKEDSTLLKMKCPPSLTKIAKQFLEDMKQMT